MLRRSPLRDGAFNWGVMEDPANPELLTEWFLVESWAEHLRQHRRVPNADADLQRDDFVLAQTGKRTAMMVDLARCFPSTLCMNLARAFVPNKLILLHGPNGSAKSTWTPRKATSPICTVRI